MGSAGGIVYLVGGGPGAPDLITIRGRNVLRRAEVVVYDNLVNPELLALAGDSAALIYAGKRGGSSDSFDQAELNRILVERARRGLRVVRLKGGDPFIFGRGGEEAEALVAAGVRFEVVPGVTSAIAGPAFAGIPLTHREYGSFVAFLTGHQDGAKRTDGSTIPWETVASAAHGGGTIVLLMATARLGATLERIVAGGLAPETPAAAIQSATTASQRTVRATLGTLGGEVERAGIGAPAVIVIGECVALGASLGWAERAPLFGRRIVITRARARSGAFAEALREMGAEAIEFPVIQTVAPDSFDSLDSALARLADFDWIVFTSPTGVEAFVDRIRESGRDLREAARAKLAAIGPATAARLRHYALSVAAIPREYRAEAIVAAIGTGRVARARFLIPRAQVAREVLPAMLVEAGAREVVVAPAYKTVRPASANAARIRKMAAAGAIDLVVFTSSSTVANFVAIAGPLPPAMRAAAIGPITAASAREAGFEVVIEPREYTIAALTSVIRDYFSADRTIG